MGKWMEGGIEAILTALDITLKKTSTVFSKMQSGSKKGKIHP